MPDRYVLDAHAWVEYLRGSLPGKRVKEVVDNSQIYTNTITLAEVVSHVSKEGGNADLAAQAIQTISDIVDLDNELALKTGKRFARMKGKKSLEQAYLIETAKKLGARILSGDRRMVSGRAVHIHQLRAYERK